MGANCLPNCLQKLSAKMSQICLSCIFLYVQFLHAGLLYSFHSIYVRLYAEKSSHPSKATWANETPILPVCTGQHIRGREAQSSHMCVAAMSEYDSTQYRDSSMANACLKHAATAPCMRSVLLNMYISLQCCRCDGSCFHFSTA